MVIYNYTDYSDYDYYNISGRNNTYGNYYTYDTDDDDEIWVSKKKTFDVRSTIALCGIVTNIALLCVLMIRLVKDIRKGDTAKARWAKRHFLIAMCVVHVVHSFFYGIMTEAGNHKLYTNSVSACRFLRLLWAVLDNASILYGVVLAFHTLIHIFVPTFLIGEIQKKLWLLIHGILWSCLLLGYGVYVAVVFKMATMDFGRRGTTRYCKYHGSVKVEIALVVMSRILPVGLLVLSAIIACLGQFLNTARFAPITDNCEMIQWMKKTKPQAILFLIIFSLFSCATYLPVHALSLWIFLNPDTAYTDDTIYLYRQKATQLLAFAFRLLFPVCCLILDETWLCSAIDRRVFRRKVPVAVTYIADTDQEELERPSTTESI